MAGWPGRSCGGTRVARQSALARADSLSLPLGRVRRGAGAAGHAIHSGNRCAGAVAGGGGATPAAGPPIALPIAWWTSIELAIAFWIVWATVYAARLAAAATAIRRARRQCQECPAEVEERLPHWISVRASGRRTRLVLSTDIRTAAVLGCGSPVIAIAPALLTNLSDADLDRVVIHEWAHVQRRDDVMQLVQRLVRVVAGWHPAVWWLGRQLDLEREVACDEMAVAATGSARAYAACLTTLAALRLPPLRSLPAPAVVSSRGLRQRIVRILAAHPVATTSTGCVLGVGAGVAISALALVVGNVRVVQPATRSIVVADVGGAAAAPTLATTPPTTVSRMVQSSGSSSATRRRGRPAGATMRIANRGNDLSTSRVPRSLDGEPGCIGGWCFAVAGGCAATRHSDVQRHRNADARADSVHTGRPRSVVVGCR